METKKGKPATKYDHGVVGIVKLCVWLCWVYTVQLRTRHGSVLWGERSEHHGGAAGASAPPLPMALRNDSTPNS